MFKTSISRHTSHVNNNTFTNYETEKGMAEVVLVVMEKEGTIETREGGAEKHHHFHMLLADID